MSWARSYSSSASAAEIGFQWDPHALAWVRPGLPLLSNLAGPFQHFKAALLDAWRNKVAADLCGWEGFRGGPLLDVHGSLQLFNSSHVRERDEALLRAFMVGGVWNGFLLSRIRGQAVPCRFCGPDRLCFVALWWAVSGMVCFLDGCEVSLFLTVFVVLRMVMVTFFGIALFLL